MTVDFIAQQTADAYAWVERLIQDIPQERWTERPVGLDSSVAWQVGHLVISAYYHTVMVIGGHDAAVNAALPVRTYGELFTRATPPGRAYEFGVATLRKHFATMAEASLRSIRGLSDAQLDDALEPVGPPHPTATDKRGALLWNHQHTWWHCGQLGMLRRAVHEPMAFNLS